MYLADINPKKDTMLKIKTAMAVIETASIFNSFITYSLNLKISNNYTLFIYSRFKS